jgi:hypothetical protein
MSQMWYSNETVFAELLKIAQTMLRRRIMANSIPIERYGDTLPSLAVDVVIATIERMLELEQETPTANLKARCYGVMYYIVLEHANRLWKQPKIDFMDDDVPEPVGQPLPPSAYGSIESMDQQMDRAELRQLLSTLPRVFEQAAYELFQERNSELVTKPAFLECAIARLGGSTARESWKPFEGLKGGSWQNMEKLYGAWREILRRRLRAVGAESLVGLEGE